MSTIKTLSETIIQRKLYPVDGSYTNYLLTKGVDKICKKIGEEATEVVIAAKNGDIEELVNESSDLLYHLLVLLANQNVDVTLVLDELERRTEKVGNLKVQNEKGEL